MSITFQAASRKRQKLRLALYGVSGSGKTLSALRLAKGIAGPKGHIAVIDTEHGSSELYADRMNFDVVQLDSDKSVDRYIEAMYAAVQAGYQVLVIDSISHAWREILELADSSARNGNRFSGWAKATPKQKQFIQFILASPIHIIATMRADTAWELDTNDKGKKEPRKIGLKPEQGKGIDYEFTMVIRVDTDHSAVFEKDRSSKFQDRAVKLITEDIGRELLAWLNEGEGDAKLPPSEVVEPADETPGLDDLVRDLEEPEEETLDTLVNELVELNAEAGHEVAAEIITTKIVTAARRAKREPIDIARERVAKARQAMKGSANEGQS